MRVTREGISPMGRGVPTIQRISPCDKDRQEADRREFEAKGLDLIRSLRKELADAKRQTTTSTDRTGPCT